MRSAGPGGNCAVEHLEGNRRNIDGVGAAIFAFAVDMPSYLIGQAVRPLHHFVPGPDSLYLQRTSLDAGGQLTEPDPVETAVALEHHAVAGEIGQQVEVGADAGLAFRHLPRTYVFAFAAPHADFRMKEHGAVTLFEGSAKRAQVDARRIMAVHAAPGDMYLEVFAVVATSRGLDRQPVERRQAVAYRLFFRWCPVGNLHPAVRESGRDGSFQHREFVLVDVPARLHAGLAADAFAQVENGAQRRAAGCMGSIV